MRSSLLQLRNNEAGSVMVLAFVLLVVLTVIGIFATRTAQIDLQVASNEVPYKQNFYIAEGGLNREVAELINTSSPTNVRPAGDETFTDRSFLGNAHTYSYLVHYLGAFVPPKGYGTETAARYDYRVQTKAGGTAASGEVTVKARVYKIGPAAQ
jgi:hypothetical protein